MPPVAIGDPVEICVGEWRGRLATVSRFIMIGPLGSLLVEVTSGDGVRLIRPAFLFRGWIHAAQV